MDCQGQDRVAAGKQVTEEINYFYDAQHFTATVLILCILIFLYKKIWIPFDYQQGLPGRESDAKFSFIGASKGIVTRDLARLSAHLRKSGNKLPPPYPNGWFAILESSNLRPGCVEKVDYLGECLAVFRTESGAVHALNAYCSHLGANMAVGGTVIGDCLQCPFHNWTFSGDSGNCVSIPDVETVPKGASVRAWHVCEVDGMIFAWHHSEGGPPRWSLPSIKEIEGKKYRYMGRNDFLVACHIQEIQENGADVAHLNPVHNDNLLSGKILSARDAWNHFGRHIWSGNWSHSTTCQHEAIGYLCHEVRIFDKFSLLKMDVNVKQIGPGYVHVFITFGPVSMAVMQTSTPISPLVQRVIHRMYAPLWLKPLANLTMWGETIMLQRDVTVWNSKAFVSNPLLVKTDRFLKAYRTWYKQFYADTSESFEDAVKRSARGGVMDW